MVVWVESRGRGALLRSRVSFESPGAVGARDVVGTCCACAAHSRCHQQVKCGGEGRSGCAKVRAVRESAWGELLEMRQGALVMEVASARGTRAGRRRS
jgi:hypothetical protein